MSGFFENVDGHRVWRELPDAPAAPAQQVQPGADLPRFSVAPELLTLLNAAKVNPDSLDRHYGVKLTFTRDEATALAEWLPALADRLHNAVGNAAADEDYDEQQRRDVELLRGVGR